ncbi:MAG TPA: efflux RND transporter periplasmic adaptor subunit [Xanthomonadaceae bacterium]|jgi:RND family efflux transporter MFP subunit|nr:efflux RND transporter periplasmic adaptor subunit [Xanthomonadaceae bacterium]
MNHPQNLLNELRIERNAPASPRSWRWLWILLGVLALLAVIAGGVLMLRGDNAPQVHVATATAIGGASGNASVLDATGYVTARREATVSAKITGKVKGVFIEEGQHVDAGYVMATLDPVDAQADRSLAQAQVASSRSQVNNIQAQLKSAEADAARYTELASRKLVSRSQLDQSVASRDALRAQLDAAQRNVQVALDNAHIADNGVDNTVVRAPFSGVIIDKAAQAGEIVSPLSAGGGFTRTGIGTIVDMDSLEVQVDVNEAYIGRVQPKMPVESVLNAYPDWKIPSEVIAIIPTADRSKATVKVRIALKSKDPRILPDMGARVSFLEKVQPANVATTKPGVLVPASAVVSRGGVDSAFVVDGDKVKRHPLKLGRTLGDDREIVEGLAAGDSVVTDPPAGLVEGAHVRISTDKPSDAPDKP